MDRNQNDSMFNHCTGAYTHSGTHNVSKNAFYSSSVNLDASLNPRQIFWIKKRKIRRESLDALMKLKDSNYIYESRHRHAMKRQRAASGRFLTKHELHKMNDNVME